VQKVASGLRCANSHLYLAHTGSWRWQVAENHELENSYFLSASATAAYGLRLINVPQFAAALRTPPGIISVASQMVPLALTATAE
jgi:hypothetical protein